MKYVVKSLFPMSKLALEGAIYYRSQLYVPLDLMCTVACLVLNKFYFYFNPGDSHLNVQVSNFKSGKGDSKIQNSLGWNENLSVNGGGWSEKSVKLRWGKVELCPTCFICLDSSHQWRQYKWEKLGKELDWSLNIFWHCVYRWASFSNYHFWLSVGC